jgi:hypothetical protein
MVGASIVSILLAWSVVVTPMPGQITSQATRGLVVL